MKRQTSTYTKSQLAQCLVEIRPSQSSSTYKQRSTTRIQIVTQDFHAMANVTKLYLMDPVRESANMSTGWNSNAGEKFSTFKIRVPD